MKKTKIVFALLCVGAMMLFAGCGDKDAKAIDTGSKDEGKKGQDKIVVEELKNDPNTPINYEAFKGIALGASLDDVEKVFGKGAKVEGLDGSEVYAWRGNGLANVMVEIRDGKVIEKSQGDLVAEAKDIKLGQVASIDKGASLADVEKKIGPGVLIREAQGENGGPNVTNYEWKNANGSAFTIEVVDGKVTSAYGVGLPE